MSVVPLRRIAPAIAAAIALHALLLGWEHSRSVGVDIGWPQAPAMSTRWISEPRAQEPVVTPVPRLPERGPTHRVQRSTETSARPAPAPPIGNAPADAQKALREGIASGARGDCLKGGEGGYANANMGLFALPLLAVDAATGRCR